MKYVLANGKLHLFNRSLFDKSMKFYIVVVHDLTNDISHVVKLNRSKIFFWGGGIVKIMCKNREKWENICSICISVFVDKYWSKTFCTVVVHILNKDITYDTKR